jgi:AbrB family looped-hinge helix DNA binding protein
MNCQFILFAEPRCSLHQCGGFNSRRLVCRPEISIRSTLLFVWAASALIFGLNLPVYTLEPCKVWVASWATSPQGPYPAGRPVAQPDLSFALPRGDTDGATDQTFRLLTIDKAGRVVIPKPLREELHLEPGDALEMESVGEQITLRPVRGTGPLTKEHGVWVFHTGQPLPVSVTNKMLQQIREERDLANLSRGE